MHKKPSTFFFAICFLLIYGFTFAATAPSPKLTTEDMEAFMNGLVPLQLEREDIAGVVVTIVKDGEVIFAKGYGFADMKNRKPVTPDRTLFRPGSVSKLFTWTAVMQLVEQGKLDLDRDVNEYLDFKIPAKFNKPITLRNIMTHSPGFEETAKDLFVAKASDLQPLSKYLPTHIPNQIFPPGEISAYSNYATALAGYIVQRVSGREFNEYLREFIFKPLDMQHSTFVQPLPQALQPLMSNGYKRASDDKPQDFELVNVPPAGSLSSSGTDMARFMLAFLGEGRLGNAQILKPETVRLMHTKQLALHPKANGMALGFYEESRNGLRIVGHAGDTVCFHSDLHLIPEAEFGFFVSYNSGGRGEVSGRDALWHTFLDRYFPYNPPQPKPLQTAKDHSAEVSGTYLVSRREETTILRLLYRMLQLTVAAQRDNTIQADQLTGFNGKPKRWQEVEPYIYQEVHGQEQIMFRRNAAGKLQLVIPFPFMSFEKVSGLDSMNVLRAILIFTIAVLLLAVLFWPINGLTRRHYGKPLTLNPQDRRYRRLSRIAILLILAFLTLFSVLIITAFDSISALSSHRDPLLRMVNVLGIIAALGTLFVFYYAYRTWKNPERRIWVKLFETLVALGALAYLVILSVGNLFFFNLQY